MTEETKPNKKNRSRVDKTVDLQHYYRNRERRLYRHLKSHPEDIQAAKALTHLHYRRKNPTRRVWSKANIRYARCLRRLGFNGNLALIDLRKRRPIGELDTNA